jgi:orotate phosphoribosyltransferase
MADKTATLRKRYIEAVYREKAFLITEEKKKLHHGGESHIFLNHNQFLSKFDNLKLLTDIYAELIPKLAAYTLGAVDSIMSPVFCGLLAAKLEKNVTVIKEKKLEHGLENKIYGDVKGEVVLIDDVTSTGALLVNAAQALSEKGAIVRYAIVSACRDESATLNLKKAGIKVLYVATYEEILQTLWKSLSVPEKKWVKEEISEKHYSWKL